MADVEQSRVSAETGHSLVSSRSGHRARAWYGAQHKTIYVVSTLEQGEGSKMFWIDERVTGPLSPAGGSGLGCAGITGLGGGT